MRPLRFILLLFMALPRISAAELKDETLLTNLPPGYKVDFHAKRGNLITTEMVPRNESVKNWTEMVTVQVFLGAKNAALKQYQVHMEKTWLGVCKGGKTLPITNGEENGYLFALWALSCPLNPTTRKPEFTWFKAIQGNDSLYIVQKAFKFEPSKEQTAQWMQYLSKVSVCDTRLPDRDCPKLENKSSASPFREGETTADEVKAVLGDPEYIDQNPDGRFVYVYSMKGGKVTYLFDAEKMLIRIRGFANRQ